MDNLLEIFLCEIYKFLTGRTFTSRTMLIKRHADNLQTYGDFSFVNLTRSWHPHISTECKSEESLMDLLGITTDDIILESKNWRFKIFEVRIHEERICLFLNRPLSIEVGLKAAFHNNQTITEKLKHETDCVYSDPTCVNKSNLTYLRLQHLVCCIKNLIAVSIEKPSKICVSFRSSNIHKEEAKHFLCGPVLNVLTGAKEVDTSSDEYIHKRQDDMMLIAQHRYGVRQSTCSKWKAFIDSLGASAVKFELLQIKPCNPVKLSLDCPSVGPSKGAAFVLYNCARLENILQTFNEQVEQKLYPNLPEFEKIDWSLLSDEDEWILIFAYIMGLPDLLENAVSVNENSVDFRPHQVCSYLSSMVRVFSQYYRRVRILTEPRKHLLPVLFARIHMLKLLSDSLKVCLKILNIESVQKM